MKFTPPVASGDLKTFLPERKKSPAKAGGEMLRILEIVNDKKDNHPYKLPISNGQLVAPPVASGDLKKGSD
jgi:hypothetical protein